MIGVVIPAHDEERLVAACLRSVQAAARHPRLLGEAVHVMLVLDACSDRTAARARGLAHLLAVDARNVGVARAAGAAACIRQGCRWLAFTDADSEVAPDWLADQLEAGSDAVCGTIAIRHWESYGAAVRQQHLDTYTDADDHRHIHGANLGVSASAYLLAGGFQPMACSEDVALVRALESSGATISWTARPRVWTSARRQFRAPDGFGQALLLAERRIASRPECELPGHLA